MSTIPGANEGEVEYDDGEMDYDSQWTITHPCGHTSVGDGEGDPQAADPCWGCQICSGCQNKHSDCSCPMGDPFAEGAEG